jgi:hypothetical protein
MSLPPGVLRNQQPGFLLRERLCGGRLGDDGLDARGLNDGGESQNAKPGAIRQRYPPPGRPGQAGLDLGFDQASVGKATLQKAVSWLILVLEKVRRCYGKRPSISQSVG